MSKISCVYVPSRGSQLFRALRKQYDYKTSRSIFLRAISPEFINAYKDTLTLDSEGIPTFDSLLNNSFMKKFIGANNIQLALQKKFPQVEDTRENYNNLLSSAYQFNTSDPQSSSYTAIVSPTNDGKIGIVIKPRSEESLKEFQDQYATSQLNDRLEKLFSPLGVTVNNLTQTELRAGRVGKTNFTAARDLGTSFANIISVANNSEGERAISEEFSHLIIGMYRGEPLVTRAINTLKENPDFVKQVLGDNDYEDTMKFHDNNMELAAEEALGHILQRNLLKSQEELTTPAPSLFRRLYNWIINKFKGYNKSDVLESLDAVESSMSVLAHNILDGTRNITSEDIKQSQRDAEFNALSDRIDRNIEILRNSAKTEIKKYKITGDTQSKDFTESKVNEILEFTDRDADTVEGIFNYAKQAVSTLRVLEGQFQLIDSMNPKQKFSFLRNVRMYVQSYGSFLEEMQDALNDEKTEEDNMFLRNFALEDGTIVSTEDVIKELNQMSDSLNSRFFKVAGPAFVEFLKPFMGESIVVPFGKNAGQTITIEELMKEAPSDISFMDRWLQSMADSSDVLLQGFDAAVKSANNSTRLEVIDRFNKIHAWREKVESLGITDFEWVFETDDEGNKSGNYISGINHAQFQKELREMLSNLDEKYGINPTGTAAQEKLAEKHQWLEVHSINIFGDPQPNPVLYRNEAYYGLSDTQKEVFNEFLAFKDELDKMHPENRTSLLKAIQVRKSGSERFWESVTSPSTLFENVKESIAASLLDREDDDQIFGETTKRGLTDFAGNEFMVLPVLYTNRLKNPNEISTDLIGALMAYTYSAVQYKNLDNIVDALEVGKTLVSDPILGRKVSETRGNKKVMERFEALNTNVTNQVFTSRSNIEAKLKDFMESKVYQRYMKDEGTWHIPLIDKDVNKGKFVNAILKGSSLAQLGFNWLANVANVATGVGMQNIEAAAGQFFTPKELAKADIAYFKDIAHVVSEANSRNKTNKVSLFFDLFNIKQNFEGNSKRLQTRNWLKRLFGEEVAFLGQELGDHWMYGRTGIAMAMREQVLLNGQQMSLWDALQVKDYKDSNSVKELDYKDITDLDGNPFDVGRFSERVAHVNQVCFGIYNDEDANAANRVAVGRLLQQYRKWMTIQYSRRFREGHANLATNTWEEGYYRTLGRYLTELKRGGFQFAAQYHSMTDEEQRNIRRAIFELAQFFAVWALANWVEWPDDKNRPWALKLAEYSTKRLAHELGGLAPSTVMPQELLKTVKSPIPATSVVQNTFNLVNSAINPADWNNEISSGPYKGMSNLEKNFIKAPIPGVAQYRQIDKFVGDLDSSISYYMRPY